jgi:hypothetical protein
MKSESEIREQVARVRDKLKVVRDAYDGDDPIERESNPVVRELYDYQQALGWVLDELLSPIEMSELYEMAYRNLTPFGDYGR